MKKLQNWYNNKNNKQRIMIWAVFCLVTAILFAIAPRNSKVAPIIVFMSPFFILLFWLEYRKK
jgi:uncharacterized membrane protein YbaN (DUF454 family)